MDPPIIDMQLGMMDSTACYDVSSVYSYKNRWYINTICVWWLHASEYPSSILCVVSGHLCAFHLIKTYFQALFILLCQIKHYHTIQTDSLT